MVIRIGIGIGIGFCRLFYLYFSNKGRHYYYIYKKKEKGKKKKRNKSGGAAHYSAPIITGAYIMERRSEFLSPKDIEILDESVKTDEELLEGYIYTGEQAMAGGLQDALGWFKVQGIIEKELLCRGLKVNKCTKELVTLTRKQAFKEIVDDLSIQTDLGCLDLSELRAFADNLGDRIQRVTWSHRPISAVDPIRETVKTIRTEIEKRQEVA